MSMFSPGYHERKFGMKAPMVPPAIQGLFAAMSPPASEITYRIIMRYVALSLPLMEARKPPSREPITRARPSEKRYSERLRKGCVLEKAVMAVALYGLS